MTKHTTLTSAALYDMIMKTIEPDLLRKKLEKAETRRKEESDTAYMDRMEGYRLAFIRFDTVLNDLREVSLQRERFTKQSTRRALHQKEKEEKEREVSSAEHDLLSSHIQP